MILFSLLFFSQIGIEAGPARVSCGGSTLTLEAIAQNPPSNYSIRWEDNLEDGVFLIVAPNETASYRVFLTDLDTGIIYTDDTIVRVHPGSPDLSLDDEYNLQDFLELYSYWPLQGPNENYDPDGDGQVTILDRFYFCDFEVDPPNTPPVLVVNDVFTTQGDTVTIPFLVSDAEQEPTVFIQEQAQNGFAFFLNGELRYSPAGLFIGGDRLTLVATDGFIQLGPVEVFVQVIPADTFADIYTDIFENKCWACHIDATSGGLNLSTFSLAQEGGVSGPGFVAGFPHLSPIFLRVASGEMPLGGTLTTHEIERIRLWIVRGAAPSKKE